ncbi:MAG: site-specific DNA-methyltransferase, partial [Candidatus Rehaiarchaeum fermentans]|nr:site-specific DNA-methyltransferase [Candidatus Rehaiarchaeum fermentans]
QLSEAYKFLPIDTKYFKDLEIEILGLFDDLDSELDGWLIHSENYQALNTILPKFKERVQTIYIDPPFNKEQNADYLYKVKYKDSTWATMLENRLRLARDLLKDTGSIFVRCDYNGNWIVRPLMDEVFGKENFRNEIILRRYTGLPKTGGVKLEEDCDYLIYSCKNQNNVFFRQLFKEIEPKWMNLSTRPSSIEINKPIVIEGKEFYPPKFQRWALSQETVLQLLNKGRAKIENNTIKILIDKSILGTNWTNIPGYSVTTGFKTKNSEILLKRVIESTSKEGDLVMDFFLGSGTTTAVAHKLKRRWIGVEMGEQFYTFCLPRMKKVLAYDKSEISKENDVREKYNEKNAGGFFKYYDLEQYEQTLRKCHYIPSEPFFNLDDKSIYEQYIFMKDPKLLDSMELDYANNKIRIDFNNLYENIDIAETLSLIKGMQIKSIGRNYVILDNNGNEVKIDYNDIDFKTIKPLMWW